MKSRWARAVFIYVIAAVALTLLSIALNRWIVAPPGLVRSVYPELDFQGERLSRDITPEVSLRFLGERPELPRDVFSVRWRGFWFLPSEQEVEIHAGGDDEVVVFVDGELALSRNAAEGKHSIARQLRLGAGPHRLVVGYEQHGGVSSLDVLWAPLGASPRPFHSTQLFPGHPDTPDYLLAAGTFWLTRLTVVVWLVPAIGLLLPTVRRAQPYLRTARDIFNHVTGMTVTRTLHVFALSALAVAQPLFTVVSQEPTFFVARNTTVAHLVALVGLVCIALPTILVVGEIVLVRFSATAAGLMHGLVLTVMGSALLLPPLKRVEALGTVPSMALALLLAGALALAYRRYGAVRSFVTALSPAVVIVPAAFLMNADVRDAVVSADVPFASATVTETPPIVLIVFDEFPVSSLMDGTRAIDAARYPNFARLAETATWYRNASTVSSQTLWAVPAIVSGTLPVAPNAVPTRRYFPNNLFTMLSESYQMHVFGRFLQLCPANRCLYDLEVHDSLGELVADLGIVYLHIISPDSIAATLPPIVGDWRAFATRRRFRNDEGRRSLRERSSEFDRFLETITPDREGRLYFLHTLMPHMPFEYVPSGHRYLAPDYQNHREGGASLFLQSDPWLPRVLQQRHLLQVGFVDRLVGKLLDRLEAQGIYDEVLLIMTADHGASFQHGMPRRTSADGSRADVMLVPLLIKYPGQVTGRVTDQNAETVDIVPTIANVLSTTAYYDVDGRSLLDANQPQKAQKSFVKRTATDVRVETYDPVLEDRYASLETRLQHFAAGVYALGPHAALVGRPLSSLDVRTGQVTAVHLEDPRFDDVDLDSETLPLYVRGAVTESIGGPVSVAIAVNGVIVATTQSYQENDERVFASMIPEDALKEGVNDLQAFVVDDTGDTAALLRGQSR